MCAEALCHALYVREILLKMACGKHTARRVNTPNCVRNQWRANTTVTLKYLVAITQMWKFEKSRESSGGLQDTADYTRYVGKWSSVDRMTCAKFVLNVQIWTQIANRNLATAASCRLRCKTCNGKAIPLQAWRGPEGSRRLRLPDFKTIGTWRW
jgi:hypothetical protein